MQYNTKVNAKARNPARLINACSPAKSVNRRPPIWIVFLFGHSFDFVLFLVLRPFFLWCVLSLLCLMPSVKRAESPLTGL